VAIYRIALEALTNVIHHARAQNCQIRLSTSLNPRPEIYLEIVDDGVGLPANIKSGVGITSMRERAKELGGHLSIESMLPSGTRVCADIPLVSEDS
jgi:signal transduction histidine kinase